MLKITVQKLGDASVLHCHGRIVAGDAGSILRSAVLNQRHTRTVVIDLAGIERIDAGGVGVLLSLRESARSRAMMLKLMNATELVEEILERTHLRPVFEFCSVPELFCLLHRAGSLTYCSADRSSRADENDRGDYSVGRPEAVPPLDGAPSLQSLTNLKLVDGKSDLTNPYPVQIAELLFS